MSNNAKIFIALGIIVALGWLMSSLLAVLMPFTLAAVMAYVCSPLAQKLEKKNLSPNVIAVTIVVLLMSAVLSLVLILLPLIIAQINDFLSLFPVLIGKVRTFLDSTPIAEWLKSSLADFDSLINPNTLKVTAGRALSFFGEGVNAIIAFFTVVLITPLATFYFVRDRRSIGGELIEILPPYWRDAILRISRDFDDVLGEFLHGQLLVIVMMIVFYSFVLKIIGLDFAFTIGFISGVLVFIPYIGFLLGFILATIVGLGSFDSWLSLLFVWGGMIVGTVAESLLITPRLIGNRIGLHPLIVLLSLVVMGDLFGFVGVLLSLPSAALLLVCIRHLRRFYIRSNFYKQGSKGGKA